MVSRESHEIKPKQSGELLFKRMISVFYFFQQPGTHPMIGFLQNRLDRAQHILIAGPKLFDDLFVNLLLLVDVEIEHIKG